MASIIDSCVYLDVFTRDPRWFDWSTDAIAEAADAGTIVMNAVIYAEISVNFDRIERLELLLPSNVVDYRAIPREAAFLAGKCYLKYRKRGGTRTSPLPDFLIGAHAAVTGLPVVTRDARRFREYFPGITIVSP